MDQVNLGMVFGGAGRRVDVVTAKVLAILQRVLDGDIGKVLAAERHDLALRNEACELVLARIAQGAELDASDLSPGGRGKVADCHAFWKQVRVRRIGILAVFDVFERLERGVFLLGIPGGQVLGILFLVLEQCILPYAWGRRHSHLCRLELVVSVCLCFLFKLDGRQLLISSKAGWCLESLDRQCHRCRFGHSRGCRGGHDEGL